MVTSIRQLQSSFPAIAKHRWISVGKREDNSVLNRDLYVVAYGRKRIKRMTGINHQCGNLLFIRSEVFIAADEFQKFSDTIVARALRHPAYLLGINSKMKASCSSIRRYSERIKNQNFEGGDIGYLSKLFNTSIAHVVNVIAFSYVFQNQEEIPRRIIDHIIERRKVEKKDIGVIREKLLIPLERETLFQQEIRDLLEIARRMPGNSTKHVSVRIRDEIVRHIQKYDWINSKYFNVRKVTYAETRRRLSGLRNAGAADKADDREKEFKETVMKLKLHQPEMTLLHAVREQLYYKTLRKELLFLFSAHATPRA